MAQYGLAAYYVPYDAEGRREWISGFTGSNGDAIVTHAASGDQVRYMSISHTNILCMNDLPIGFRRLAGLMDGTFFKHLVSWLTNTPVT